MMRVFIFLIGFGISVIGGITSIAYLNIIGPKQGWHDYLRFISTRAECYFLPIGIFLIWLSMYFPYREE